MSNSFGDKKILPMTSAVPAGPLLPPLLPVLDTLGGKVVWAVAGQRQSYRPLESPLVKGSRPLAVAGALRELVGHDWLYLADLDAIQQDAPDWQTLERLAADGCQLVLDAGLRDAGRARQLVAIGARLVVAALETLPGPAMLSEIVETVGGERTLFSLDLRNGALAGPAEVWGGTDPQVVARSAIQAGIGGMIVLDVAGVGVANGVPTAALCRQVRAASAGLPLITGGGVRSIDDVGQLLADGVTSVLVASALHTGRIGPPEIACLGR